MDCGTANGTMYLACAFKVLATLGTGVAFSFFSFFTLQACLIIPASVFLCQVRHRINHPQQVKTV